MESRARFRDYGCCPPLLDAVFSVVVVVVVIYVVAQQLVRVAVVVFARALTAFLVLFSPRAS